MAYLSHDTKDVKHVIRCLRCFYICRLTTFELTAPFKLPLECEDELLDESARHNLSVLTSL